MKNFSIVKNWKVFFAITFIFLMIGYGSMIFRGFNLGIDFTGGSIMDLKFEKPVKVAQVREVMSRHDLGAAVIQLFGGIHVEAKKDGARAESDGFRVYNRHCQAVLSTLHRHEQL